MTLAVLGSAFRSTSILESSKFFLESSKFVCAYSVSLHLYSFEQRFPLSLSLV